MHNRNNKQTKDMWVVKTRAVAIVFVDKLFSLNTVAVAKILLNISDGSHSLKFIIIAKYIGTYSLELVMQTKRQIYMYIYTKLKRCSQ